jgi:mxaD protein
MKYLAAALVLCGTAHAAEVTETINTTATPKAVWALVSPFDGIVNWLPGVVSSPADKGDAVGSVRVITLGAPGSPTVTETETARADLTYTYRIDKVDPKVLPVTAYTATISVKPDGTGSLVTWHANFQPAGGADDAAAEKAVSGLFKSGLAKIKTVVEK